MKFFQKRSFFSFMIALGVGANLFCGAVLTARAEVIDYQALAEANLSIPVESNEIKNWPEGPILNARSAILMDADSGAILYAKNIHEKLYPASTTKILTAYIARQNSELNEMIEYSDTAVHSIEVIPTSASKPVKRSRWNNPSTVCWWAPAVNAAMPSANISAAVWKRL